MTYLTKQEIFDKAVAGLAAQGFQRSVLDTDNMGLCLYRNPNGRRCAAGHVIVDSAYDPLIEGKTVTAFQTDPALDSDEEVAKGKAVERALEASGVNTSEDDVIYFLAEVQQAHDYGDYAEGMKNRLRKVGEKYGMTLPEVLR